MEKTHPGLTGQVGWVTRLGGAPNLTWECEQEKKRDCMDRLGTPPRRGISPARGVLFRNASGFILSVYNLTLWFAITAFSS